MSGVISVVNKSKGVIRVFIDDELVFQDILPGETTRKKPVPIGTRCVLIFNNRERLAWDILFSAQKNTHIILFVSDASVYLTQIPAHESGEAPSFLFWKPEPGKPR